MKELVRKHFEIELSQAQSAIEAGNLEMAWTALQRVHILGQAYPLSHAIAHWKMLKLAWKQQDAREFFVQLISLTFIPLSLLFGRGRALRGGRVRGNLTQNNIPEDLFEILEQSN
jgi:hypothetical protein